MGNDLWVTKTGGAGYSTPLTSEILDAGATAFRAAVDATALPDDDKATVKGWLEEVLVKNPKSYEALIAALDGINAYYRTDFDSGRGVAEQPQLEAFQKGITALADTINPSPVTLAAVQAAIRASGQGASPENTRAAVTNFFMELEDTSVAGTLRALDRAINTAVYNSFPDVSAGLRRARAAFTEAMGVSQSASRT